jgi:hypothetical protein
MYRILSIDGGGIRGLIPATILATIECRAGKPIGQLVDLVAGTSTGGIIAAAVGAGIPMGRVKQLYSQQGQQIFSRGPGQELESLGGLTDVKYSAKGLESCLAELFLDRHLSETGPAEVLITSCHLSGEPHLFKSHKAKASRGDDYLLTEVTRATSAAPTYFEPAEVKDLAGVVTRHLVDGGLAANDPAMCAVVEAPMVGGRIEDLTVISIGTGADQSGMTIKAAQHCGLLNGGLGIVKMVFNGSAASVDYQCRQLLGGRYIRLQPTLPRPMDMDATDQDTLATLEGLAAQICESPEFEHVLEVLGLKEG